MFRHFAKPLYAVGFIFRVRRVLHPPSQEATVSRPWRNAGVLRSLLTARASATAVGEGGLELRRVTPCLRCHGLLPVGLHWRSPFFFPRFRRPASFCTSLAPWRKCLNLKLRKTQVDGYYPDEGVQFLNAQVVLGDLGISLRWSGADPGEFEFLFLVHVSFSREDAKTLSPYSRLSLLQS